MKGWINLCVGFRNQMKSTRRVVGPGSFGCANWPQESLVLLSTSVDSCTTVRHLRRSGHRQVPRRSDFHRGLVKILFCLRNIGKKLFKMTIIRLTDWERIPREIPGESRIKITRVLVVTFRGQICSLVPLRILKS